MRRRSFSQSAIKKIAAGNQTARAFFLNDSALPVRLREPMKFVVIWSLSFLALTAPLVAGENLPKALERIQLLSRDYVRLQDWATANHFQSRWLERLKVASFTNRTDRLVFTVNSKEAQINGINIWLSHPVLMSAGVPCLSQLDLQTIVQPLLQPAKNTGGAKLKLIVLDPGHGGKDTGNIVGYHAEKKYTLLLANEIRDILKKSGIKVALTRNNDSFVELPERPAKAERLGADLFVSLHFNATEEDRNNVQGAEVYCLTPAGVSSTNAGGRGADTPWVTGNRNNDKNILLAYQLQRSLVRNLDVEDRGVRRARFAVLRDALMPAILIEAGFMTHPLEGKKIFDANYRHQLAHAIVSGIVAYQRLVESTPAVK